MSRLHQQDLCSCHQDLGHVADAVADRSSGLPEEPPVPLATVPRRPCTPGLGLTPIRGNGPEATGAVDRSPLASSSKASQAPFSSSFAGVSPGSDQIVGAPVSLVNPCFSPGSFMRVTALKNRVSRIPTDPRTSSFEEGAWAREG
jgi:hypothetical protein